MLFHIDYIHICAEEGNEEILLVLIGHGVDLNSIDKDGNTPLVNRMPYYMTLSLIDLIT